MSGGGRGDKSSVIPAQVGIHPGSGKMDTRVRGCDEAFLLWVRLQPDVIALAIRGLSA
ncbi:hypothetical protein HNQ60_005099 [Povalibacter uvarum]|uniref:Uncharacterized protein n=1 Tax=Povalibacter uvarum TaxID=732238 RepID=A0A841HSA8_9GAMM|nr:hypothetical protein [Povalibacter uvarum]